MKSMIRIGFLGPKGTFSQEAVGYYRKNSISNLGNNLGNNNKINDALNNRLNNNINNCVIEQPFNSIKEMLSSLQEGDLTEAIVPIENSIEGAVNETLDLLASDLNLYIKGELVIPIRQNLLAREGTGIDDIQYVLSHPQPVGQCRLFISDKLYPAEVKLVYSTARAAEIVSGGEYGLKAAAIGSAVAAEVYGLKIIAENIQDNDNNYTRFVIISNKDSEKTGKDKTSLVFSTENKPGSLYRILDIFNLWDINMIRIESRPAKKQLGQYIFFVDVEGHREDDDVKDALVMVKRKTSFFKLLGSYPSRTI